MATTVRKYLTQDLNDDEKQSYLDYINGDNQADSWVEKALVRLEPLLLLELQCPTCNDWVGIRETGVCKCAKGHVCNDLVINSLNSLNNNKL